MPKKADITDLAFELGSSSPSHFTAVFRSELGMTLSHCGGLASDGWVRKAA